MATVHVALATVNERAETGATLPVPESVPVNKETLTSSATSAPSAIAGAPGQIWAVTASGGKVWAKFGAAPTASAGTDWLILDGETRYFGVSAAAEKIAVKDF